MYHFLLYLQVAVIIASVFSTLMLLHLNGSTENKYMFLAAICIDVYSIGYYQEMISVSERAIRAALAFEYCGLSFAALGYFLFITRYCHMKRLPGWVMHLMLGLCFAVLISVTLGDKTNIYYTSFTVTYGGIFPHAVTGKGFFYFLFAAFQTTLLCSSAVFVLIRAVHAKRTVDRRRFFILFLESMIPVVGIVLTVFIDLGGWDPTPFLLAFLLFLMTLTLKGGHFYDVINLAMDDLFSRVDNGIIITDSSRGFLDCNPQALSILPELEQLETGARMGDTEDDIFGPEGENYFVRNKRFYKSTYKELYERKTMVGYVVTINDITDMRKQLDDISQLKEKADAANEAKSAFLANMSHEIRTPLNAIIGMAELSEKEHSETVIREYLDQIKSSGKILLGIVNDVLDFSKAEAGKLELVSVTFDTAKFFNSIINIISMRIGDKPVDLVVDINPGLPAKLIGDDVHIRQIFMNLLSNSDKFTNSGRIALTVDGVKEDDRYKIMASVEDTGAGIREEDMDKIFDAFSQLDVKRNRKIQGTGLGLSIFAHLVTLMGGEYFLESEYGKGSKFSFYIYVDVKDETPFTKVERTVYKVPHSSTFAIYDTETSGKEVIRKTGNLPNYSDKQILVVDDNKVNVKVLCAFLKQFGVIAETAFSGQEAIDKVKEKEYDMIFMDHMMPEMDGVEAARIIRDMDGAYFKKVPIVACTANVIKGVDMMFFEAGMNGFVPKPIQMDTLTRVLEECL